MREILNMNFDWKFYDGDIDDRSFDCTHENVTKNPSWLKSGNNGLAKWGYPDQDWVDVDLPHDFVVERSEYSDKVTSSQGSLVKGIVWYRKAFELNEEDREKSVFLEFDGIFRDYEIWLNGHLLAKEVSGYKSVSYNIDDICHYDDINVVAVRVDATQYEGWWYEGGGIYRNVRMVKTSKIHVQNWGTYVRTNVSSDYKSAEVIIDTTICNDSKNKVNCVLVSQVVCSEGEIIAKTSNEQFISDYGDIVFKDIIKVDDINLWGIDNPYLYKLKSYVKIDGETVDLYETNFGIRTIEFDNETGFYLNGENIKLKGVCCHEDHAGVGVALQDGLHEYRIKLLKEMGCNAYRSSHNPPTPAILDACDKLGMVVMDETRIMDTSYEFTSQLETLIKRDRNHPSVILWSLGNEEMNIHGTDIGIRIYKHLIRIANRLDPTRKTIYAMNCDWYEITDFNEKNGFSVELSGVNYNLMRRFEGYDWLHEKYPNTTIVGTENASTLSTRGLYYKDPAINYADMTKQASHECIFEKPERSNLVSAYGEVYPPWGSTPMETWTAAATRPFVSGVFIWTGFDYRGETIPYAWPATVSHFGIMDLCGFPKDIYYYYKAWWTNQDTLHIFPHWNFKGREGELIDVCVFSNADSVELFLNDRSLGKKEVNISVKPTWEVAYESGTIKAIGYRDGIEVIKKTIETTGSAVKVGLEINKGNIIANRTDICVVNIKALDNCKRFVQTANNQLEFCVSGPAKIIGVGNGNPMSHENDKLPKRKLYYGLCQVILQSTFEEGDIIFEVKGEGIEEAQILIKSKKPDKINYVKEVKKDISEAKIIGRRDAADGLV